MLDGSDLGTFRAAKLLREELETSKKPLVIWIGAGLSRWLGYPLWNELAEVVHSAYIKYEATYDRKSAKDLIVRREYPKYFELVTKANPRRFKKLLIEIFSPRKITAPYTKAIEMLEGISPLRILTTNVDDSIEKFLPHLQVLQRSHLDVAVSQLNQQYSFVCKIHGSIGSLDDPIFSQSSYDSLSSEKSFLANLTNIFQFATVVFVGYSISDEYLLRVIRAAETFAPTFGGGPHFALLPENVSAPPLGVECLRYLVEDRGELHSLLNGIDLIRTSVSGFSPFAQEQHVDVVQPKQRGADTASAYYISDILAPGTWTTSQTFTATGADGRNLTGIIGHGMSNDEWPNYPDTSLHDLIVGLICFDRIYCNLSALSGLVSLFGGDHAIRRLIEEDTIRFISWQSEPAVIYREGVTASNGELTLLTLGKSDPTPISTPDKIRRLLKATPGREQDAENLFHAIEKVTTEFGNNDDSMLVRKRVLGALLHPSVRRLLGMSNAVLTTSIPNWLAFPVIRLSHVIAVGAITERYSIPAVKISWGAAPLAATAFAVNESNEWADEVANYVLAGRFNANLGAVIRNPNEFLEVLFKFRSSNAGTQLRQEVFTSLAKNSGPDIVASIDAGLRCNVDRNVLDSARDQMIGLFLNPSIAGSAAVIGNVRLGTDGLTLWKKKSASTFEKFCLDHRLGPYDPCPCGSTEKIKFCCGAALEIRMPKPN